MGGGGVVSMPTVHGGGKETAEAHDPWSEELEQQSMSRGWMDLGLSGAEWSACQEGRWMLDGAGSGVGGRVSRLHDCHKAGRVLRDHVHVRLEVAAWSGTQMWDTNQRVATAADVPNWSLGPHQFIPSSKHLSQPQPQPTLTPGQCGSMHAKRCRTDWQSAGAQPLYPGEPVGG